MNPINLILHKTIRMFGKDDPPSTAATIVEFLFKPLALHGLIYEIPIFLLILYTDQ